MHDPKCSKTSPSGLPCKLYAGHFGSHWNPQLATIWDEPEEATAKLRISLCECGSDSTPGLEGLHVDWCPEYKHD